MIGTRGCACAQTPRCTATRGVDGRGDEVSGASHEACGDAGSGPVLPTSSSTAGSPLSQFVALHQLSTFQSRTEREIGVTHA